MLILREAIQVQDQRGIQEFFVLFVQFFCEANSAPKESLLLGDRPGNKDKPRIP